MGIKDFSNNIISKIKWILAESYNQNKEKEDNYENTYIGYFNISELPEKYRKSRIRFYKYEKNSGEWVNKNDALYILSEKNGYTTFDFSSKVSGYLERVIDNESEVFLNDNDIIYKIHKKGYYANENSIDNKIYKKYYYERIFNDLENPTATFFEKWLIENGQHVNIGQSIAIFKSHNNYKEQLTYHKAEKSGIFNIINTPYSISSYNEGLHLYNIYETEELRINDIFVNTPKITIDDFTKNKNIYWETVAGYRGSIYMISNEGSIDLYVTFNYINNKDYIVFRLDKKKIKPLKGDKIFFLFDNGDIIEYEFSENILSDNDYFEIKALITIEELKLFSNNNLEKWKLIIKNHIKEIVGGDKTNDYRNYNTKRDLQTVIKKLAKEYISLVEKEIPNYKPLTIKPVNNPIEKNIEKCEVYLMIDHTNGYHKIGISNKPIYREKTLQSEKPTIELIASKSYPIRKIAESFEKALHDTFADKRIRGEWFNLDINDIENIKEALK